jgi:transketolase
MRTAFIKQLVEEAATNDKIFLIVGDLGYSVVEEFAEKYPDRFLNAGIAEQNMIGVAAGLAMEGYNVYVYSIGNFPTLRCMEQIRYDVAYHHLNVKIVSIGAGYAYGSLGASHHATEELGMMRTIPDMVVCSPCDPTEARALTVISSHYDGPMYLRLGKAGEKVVYNNPVNLKIGDLNCYHKGNSNRLLLTTGSITDYAVNHYKETGEDMTIYTVPFVKPLNKEQLVALASMYQDITVLEEHQKSCGLGSAIVEILSDAYASGVLSTYPKVNRIAINDTFYSIVGNQQYLRNLAGLTV